MHETLQPGGETPRLSTPATIGWAILIAVTLFVCYFGHLGAIGFVGPDEPRYAWIARDMVETGDWVTPRLYGKPWFEKPPLFYWGAAVCFKLFGVSEAAARLPSAICALLATLAMAWLAWRLYGAETARWLLLLLPTTVGMIGFSHAAATDMPFSGMLTIAMVCAAVVLGLTRNENSPIIPRTPWFALSLFGFFLGLAVLAKGPAAIVLCGGAVFFWALFTKRWRDAFRLLHPAALVVFCVTALPWYILCARRNPDFFRIFIIEHNFKRYLTPEFQHIQPFWFYVPVLLVAFFPWTPILLWTTCVGAMQFIRERFVSASIGFLLAWAVFCVAFFTISQSKLPGYILPTIPGMGLLLARSCIYLASRHHKSFGLFALCFGILSEVAFLILNASHLDAIERLGAFKQSAFVVLFFVGSASVFVGVVFLLSARRGARSLALAVGVAPVVASLACLAFVPSSSTFFLFSPAYIAQEIRNQRVSVNELRVSGLTRSTQFGLNFYLDSYVPEWDRDTSREVYVLTEGRGASCLQQPSEMTCKDEWLEEERLDVFALLHLVPKASVSSPTGSRQLH